MSKNSTGHVLAIITILIWGTTFISTKLLLIGFQPVEILFFRFAIGLAALTVAYPRRLIVADKNREILFALAGLSGVCLYFMLENIALTYTMASNVGVIVALTPFFTAIMTYLFIKNEEKPHLNFFIGFVVAIAGVSLISFNGAELAFNPLGDALAVLAGIVWACYSVLVKKLGAFGYNPIQMTRRIFAYGIMFIIPVLFLTDFRLDLGRFSNSMYLFNIIFLGLGASALCFATWGIAVKLLGTIRTSVYIYLTPVVTVITSMIVLEEKITRMAMAGAILALAGLVISECKFRVGKR